MRGRAAATLALLLLAAVAAAAGALQAPPPPVVFLQLSDIHYSTNVRKYWRLFGDREGDAVLWAQSVVPRIAPAAVLVTGDLTDSKTARGEGLQQEAEWLAYAALLRNLSAAGVPEARVWDVPGNHDTFDMPLRGGPNDFFAKHAAEGRRRGSHQQRVYVHQLPAAEAAPGQQQQQQEGLARPAFLGETRAALRAIHAQQPAGCGPPTILAYSHYPLSCIDSSEPHSAGPAAALAHAAHTAAAMQGLTLLLAEHNVSAVLSGHLHSAFGQRLHRLHPTPAGGHLAELESAAWKDDRRFRVLALDGGALSFAELMFHTRNAPRMPARSDAPAMREPGWQAAYAARGWAVTALDPSAAVVDHAALITWPPDGRYSPLGRPFAAPPRQQGQQDAGGAPPDGSDTRGVRALVFPLDAGAATGALEVHLAGFLPSGVQLFSQPMEPQVAQQAAQGGGADGGLLFAASGETTVSCVGARGDPAAHCHAPAEVALIQVTVKGASGRVSRSPRQPAALCCAPLTASHQRCWVAPVEGRPLPLGVSLLEWLGLAVNWPVMIHRLFLCLWALQVGGMLVAPRLLAARVLPRIAASPLLQCRAPEQPLASTPRAAAASGSATGAAGRALHATLAYLAWPLAALFLCASVTEVWAAQLAFSTYLLLGPWLLYTALSGRPPAAMFHFGVLGRLDLGAAPPGWRFISTCDTMFVCFVHLCTCLLPATLWVACVVARRLQLARHPSASAFSRCSSSDSAGSEGRRRAMEGGGTSSAASLLGGACLAAGADGGGTCSRWSFSAPQLAALAALAAGNWLLVYHKAASLMGGIALLASPGLAWTLPLALLLVVGWGGPRRSACGPARKGK